MANKRYYWLKLHKDFFKRHDIRIIEDMENGKDYILFYLKLLVESVSHEGNLRFSETIPYNEKMLSTITNTNVDVVRSAMSVFKELHMVDVLEDETIYMNEVQSLIGSESRWAIYKRNERIGQFPTDVQECPKSVQQSKSKSKSIEIDKEIDSIYASFVDKFGQEFIDKCKKYPNASYEQVASWCKGKVQDFPRQEYDFEELERKKLGK